MLITKLFCTFHQEYKESLSKLRKVYFPNIIDGDVIECENFHLLTDIRFGDSIVKTVEIQTNINNKGAATGDSKNTFLLR